METTTRTRDRHRVLACVDAFEAALKDVADVSATFMDTADKAEAMLRLTAVAGRVEALTLRVVAAADDVALDAACRTVSDWLAVNARTDRPVAARTERLAVAVDGRYLLVGAGLTEGRVSVEQAEVIVSALDHLPDGLDPQLRVKAEERLVADAAHFAPRELRRLGARILDVLAPEIADEHEVRALERELRRTEAATALTFRCRGDGATDIAARVPDHSRAGCGATWTPTPRRANTTSTAPRPRTAGGPIRPPGSGSAPSGSAARRSAPSSNTSTPASSPSTAARRPR